MKLKELAKTVEEGMEAALTYCDFPSEHRTRISTNNVIERLNRENRRCTRALGRWLLRINYRPYSRKPQAHVCCGNLPWRQLRPDVRLRPRHSAGTQ